VSDVGSALASPQVQSSTSPYAQDYEVAGWRVASPNRLLEGVSQEELTLLDFPPFRFRHVSNQPFPNRTGAFQHIRLSRLSGFSLPGLMHHPMQHWYLICL
jgi:hypothetical protein